MKPLVSILIPAYNVEHFIGHTLQSAVGQTWPRKEIIVVDDGSTDRTAAVVRQFASKGVKLVENQVAVALLSGGADRPYFFGLATSLISKGAVLDLIGNEELDFPEFHGRPGVSFLDLGGILRPEVSFATK